MILRRILSASWKSAIITFVGLLSVQVNIHFQFSILKILTYLTIPIVSFAVSLAPDISIRSYQVSIAMNFIMLVVVFIYYESRRPPKKRGGSLSLLNEETD